MEWSQMVHILIVILLVWPMIAAAAEAPALICAEGEMPEVCGLKIQREHALDELVISESKRQREQQYWALYLDGMENQRKQIDTWWRLYRGEETKHSGKSGAK
jgi:hypothetical protein